MTRAVAGGDYSASRNIIRARPFARQGGPSPMSKSRVVDAEGNEVPHGTEGEIVVRGANVMLGYWNKPGRDRCSTEERLDAHGRRRLHGRREGFVYVGDRIKDMIITGGENVYSTEVENAAASHSAVAQCAVIGIPSDKWGESVHAVIVLRPGASLSLEELRAHCRARIAGYKLPRSMEVRASLPMSSVGKVLKTDLRKTFQVAEHVA